MSQSHNSQRPQSKYRNGQRLLPSELQQKENISGRSSAPSPNNSTNQPVMSDVDREANQKQSGKSRASSRKTAPRGKKARKSSKNSQLRSQVYEVIKNNLWHTIKFIQCNDSLKILSVKVLRFMGLKGLNPDSKKPEELANCEEWCEEHGAVVSSCLNQHRSYVVSQIKTACMQYLEKFDELPSLNDIGYCVCRKSRAKDDVFLWWWDKVLPMAAGNLVHWNEQQRYYEPISGSFVPDTEQKVLNMSASTEAFAQLVYESNRIKWQKFKALKKANPGKNLKIVKNKDKVKPASGKNPNSFVAYSDQDAGLDPLYTDSRAGQQKFGGWTNEGKTQYVKLRKAAKNARKHVDTPAREDRILKLLRAEYGITADNFADQKKLSGGKAKASEDTVTEVAGLFDSDDEDFKPKKADDETQKSGDESTHSGEGGDED